MRAIESLDLAKAIAQADGGVREYQLDHSQ